MTLDRITRDAQVMAGVSCIRGTRIPVATLVAYLADGETSETITRDFPQITVEDVQQALGFAAATLREREIPLSISA